jgi:hypothetical protein
MFFTAISKGGVKKGKAGGSVPWTSVGVQHFLQGFQDEGDC